MKPPPAPLQVLVRGRGNCRPYGRPQKPRGCWPFRGFPQTANFYCSLRFRRRRSPSEHPHILANIQRTKQEKNDGFEQKNGAIGFRVSASPRLTPVPLQRDN